MSIPYEKYFNERGEVAVLYSPGFGAGWYSWNTEYPFLIFDKRLVQLVLDGKKSEAAEMAKQIAGDDYLYTGGSKDLAVTFLPVGTIFRIDEYDGSEAILTALGSELFTA